MRQEARQLPSRAELKRDRGSGLCGVSLPVDDARRRSTRRLFRRWKPAAGDAQGVVEISRVEPGQLVQGREQAIVPYLRAVNVERPFQALVDRLDTGTGDRPLPSDPENVPMQGHGAGVLTSDC